ncbi:MAG: hypothetical protein NUW23_03960 [Firmicutes bacterium]|nr:hypothetical protein [Bacillota bacterium]
MRNWLVYAVIAAMAVCAPGRASAQEQNLFEAWDPEADDNGPGSYTYPTNPAFRPFTGLFDITRFRVSFDDASVYFETTFREMTNPWNAQEGFSHQLLNIYIDTAPNAGRSDTLREGACVTFDPRYAWDVNIRIMAWGGSRVFLASDDAKSAGRADAVIAELLPDGRTIRATVSREVVGEPKETWKYYVLSASQDGYGPDNFRPVMERAGQWVFGGGSDLYSNPNVIDILAPESGDYTQARQLGSWNEAERRLAVLYPANVDPRGRTSFILLGVALGVILLLAALVILLPRARRES